MVNYCLWWRYRTSYGVIFSNKHLWGQHLQLGIFWSTTWMGKCLKMLPFNWDWKTQAVIWCYSFLRLAMFSSSLKTLGVVDQRVDLSGKTGWLTRGQVSFWRFSFVNDNTNRPTKSVILSMEVSKSMGVAPNHPFQFRMFRSFHEINRPAGILPWLWTPMDPKKIHSFMNKKHMVGYSPLSWTPPNTKIFWWTTSHHFFHVREKKRLWSGPRLFKVHLQGSGED